MRKLYDPATGEKCQLGAGSPALAAALVDARGAPLALARALAADEHWWAVVAEARKEITLARPSLAPELTLTRVDGRVYRVADNGPPVDPLERLTGFATAYAGSHKLGRCAIARLLEIAGRPEHTRKKAGGLMLAYCGMAAAYVNSPIAPGSPQRAPRTSERTERGVRAIVNRGAGRCIVCGTPLVETKLGGARRYYHDQCRPKDPCNPTSQSLFHADRAAIRHVLDAASTQLLLGVDRTRARRARDAASVPR